MATPAVQLVSAMGGTGHSRRELAERDFRNADFIHLVKRTREKLGVSIDKAHDLIWASQDMRRNGAQSRFVRVGDRISFRRKDGQRSA